MTFVVDGEVSETDSTEENLSFVELIVNDKPFSVGVSSFEGGRVSF